MSSSKLKIQNWGDQSRNAVLSWSQSKPRLIPISNGAPGGFVMNNMFDLTLTTRVSRSLNDWAIELVIYFIDHISFYCNVIRNRLCYTPQIWSECNLRIVHLYLDFRNCYFIKAIKGFLFSVAVCWGLYQWTRKTRIQQGMIDEEPLCRCATFKSLYHAQNVIALSSFFLITLE